MLLMKLNMTDRRVKNATFLESHEVMAVAQRILGQRIFWTFPLLA